MPTPLRVVVADDNLDTVISLRMLLEEDGHTLRERYGSAKPLLIAVTGRNAGSDRWLARSMGFDHYVAKPYDPNAVLALLASVRPASK